MTSPPFNLDATKTLEQKQEIESNKGVIIKRVEKGSPAFNADILEGDIIKKINIDEIQVWR